MIEMIKKAIAVLTIGGTIALCSGIYGHQSIAEIPTNFGIKSKPFSKSKTHKVSTKLGDFVKLSSKDRVTNFQNQFIVYINESNANILRDRIRLLQIENTDDISTSDRIWLESMMREYKASNMHDLLVKVDVVPRSMALAQAAIESGWATSKVARRGNVFYGQKSVKSQHHISGRDGSEYAEYSSPLESVENYMHNLNTSGAYAKFRAVRAHQRELNQQPNGQILSMTLSHYSTRGYDYERQINKLIHTHKWYELDNSPC